MFKNSYLNNIIQLNSKFIKMAGTYLVYRYQKILQCLKINKNLILKYYKCYFIKFSSLEKCIFIFYESIDKEFGLGDL